MPPLHNRRRELAELAAQEVAGESFWTEEFFESTRGRIHHAMRKAASGFGDHYIEARRLILEDEGLHFLMSPQWPVQSDFDEYLRQTKDEMVPTVIEAFCLALDNLRSATGVYDEGAFDEDINRILREDRISFELVSGEMIPFASRELHVAVVEPVLQLLRNPDWHAVEAAYLAALGELARGQGANAITDAGTALQEALLLLGASGNALGPLITSARKKGLIAGHDSAIVDALRAAAEWVSADRSVSGDAHNARPASTEDAWLTVHIVGAVILRLSAAQPRT